jgi:chemotaxis protein CheZ
MSEENASVSAERIREFLERSRADDGYSLPDVLGLAEDFASSAPHILDIDDEKILAELKDLRHYIARARAEIAALQPRTMRDERIPNADAELRAVVEHTGEATNAIMEAAEALMAADPSNPEEFQTMLNDKVMEIFEACSFQDITGQRITKVAETLRFIEERLTRFLEVAGRLEETTDPEDRDPNQPEMHGPALAAQANDQDAIDKLFDD